MTGVRILLDEHVGRVFERLLRERGYDVEQAKDRFGEQTSDAERVSWCGESGTVLLTNNAKDFAPLHDEYSNAGILRYYDHRHTLEDDIERMEFTPSRRGPARQRRRVPRLPFR